MSKKRFRPCICLILQQSCCLCSKSCYWMIGSCRYFSKVVSELSVLLTSWILVRGDPFLKVQFQFGAEPDNKKVKRLATPLHSLNRHNGLCIDRLRPVHRPCGKQVCLYRQCVGSNSLISFPSMALAFQSLQMDFCKCPSTRHLSVSAFSCPVPAMTGILQTPVPWMWC